MENRFKTRISRMFRGSFGSCRTRKLSDVIEEAVLVPHDHQDHKNVEPNLAFPSVCRTECPEAATQAINDCIISKPKRCYAPFISANGHICPPASPVSALNPNFRKELGSKERKIKNSESVKNCKNKNRNKKRKNYVKSRERNMSLFSSSSQDSAYFGDGYWFSSDEEEERDESDTLFTSRSTVSSDSSGHRSHRRRHYRGKKNDSCRRRAGGKRCDQVGVLPLEGKGKDMFAVVKSSSDPYNDFRTSMVEMIVERQMFSARELEQLVRCFLDLNSSHHHRIILEVFTEIWEALFSNWF